MQIRNADIVVSAAGRAGLVKGHWIRPGAVVVDIAVNAVGETPTRRWRGRSAGGQLCKSARCGRPKGARKRPNEVNKVRPHQRNCSIVAHCITSDVEGEPVCMPDHFGLFIVGSSCFEPKTSKLRVISHPAVLPIPARHPPFCFVSFFFALLAPRRCD